MECFVISSDNVEDRLDVNYYILKSQSILHTKFNLDKLKNLCFIHDGDHNQLPIRYISYEKEGIRYIRAQDLKEGEIISEKPIFISKEYFLTIPRSHIKPGYFLFSIMASVGSVAVAPNDLKECTANRAVGILIPKDKDKINPYYLKAFFSIPSGIKLFNLLKKGGLQQRINLKDIGELNIPVPPINIQDKISSLMEDAYKKKKEKELESQKLMNSISDYVFDELKIKNIKTLQDRCFSISSDKIKNNRADVEYHQNKYSLFKKTIQDSKYKPIKIKNCLKISSQLEDIKKYEKIKYIDLSSIKKESGKIEVIYNIDSSIIPSRARQKIGKGDLLMASLKGCLKSIAIIEEDEQNLIASTGFYVIKKESNYNNYFLLALFKTGVYQSLLEQLTTGAIMSAYNKSDLEDLEIPFPPLEIQNKIAEEVKKRMLKTEQLQLEAKEQLEKIKKEIEKIILG